MKHSLSIALTAALLAMGLARADDAHHPEGQAAKPAATGKKITPAAKPPVAKSKTANAAAPATPPAMMDNMHKMQSQMQALHAATDPAERERLLQEHMETMRDTMQMMQGGKMTRGGEIIGGDKRMEMMQMMMDQMMEHQNAMTVMRR